jgi:hypothetical protein
MIKYEDTLIKPYVDPLSNEVISWKFHLVGVDEDTGITASCECEWDVTYLESPLRYFLWTKAQIDLEMGKCNSDNHMEESIEKKINLRIAKLEKRNNPKKVAVDDFVYNDVS